MTKSHHKDTVAGTDADTVAGTDADTVAGTGTGSGTDAGTDTDASPLRYSPGAPKVRT